ncbi:GldG family protein [Paenibacillus psychroresistens]|uniref:GldG family protein n=1 Tax=Paenibacillus psychroresistens TaxID=1778678 RepID=UPI00139155AB|nr:GldG family protein [Paenibacillus psychroresistens]
MKNWLKGTNAVVLSLAVIGIFIVLTIFLHSLKGVQWDFSKDKKFTLSDQTKTTMQQLKKDVHVLAFSNQGGEVDPEITDMLSAYHKLNSKLTYEEVNLVKKPALAKQYNVTQYSTIVFVIDGKTNLVNPSDIYLQDQTTGAQSFNGEQKFTQAIVNLSTEVKHPVYLITGHGELTSETASTFTQGLQQAGYEVKDFNLVGTAQVPTDAEALILLAPQKDLGDVETKVLQDYVKGKGKLIFGLNLVPDMDKWKNWYAILNTLGIKNQLSLAIENNSKAGDPFTIVPEYGSHAITDKLMEQNIVTILQGALGLTADSANTSYQSTALLKSTADSYGKTNISRFTSQEPLTQADVAEKDTDPKGPLDLAYAIQDKDGKPKAIVIGNSFMFENDLIGQYGNNDFIMNSVGWLQEQKDQLTIRPRLVDMPQQAMISPSQGRVIQYISLIIIPLLILLLGGGIWWRRRKG